MRAAEQFDVGGAVVERGIVLTWHVMHHRYRELGSNIAELCQPPTALVRVVADVGEVTCKDNEIRGGRQRVHGGNRLGQRAARVGVGCALEAPVAVR